MLGGLILLCLPDLLVLPAEITMIEKMTHTIILMLTIDLESARECQKLSEKVYNENRCFEAYNIYSTIPPRKPDNFEDIISLYIERKKLWEK
jgi:hypothetical protein